MSNAKRAPGEILRKRSFNSLIRIESKWTRTSCVLQLAPTTAFGDHRYLERVHWSKQPLSSGVKPQGEMPK